VRAADLDPDEFFRKIAAPKYKDKLRVNTEELIARGGFGSPTMFVEGEMFFGNDRLVLVEDRLAH
jgi:2-hydroxychromene-2-carboxylate isomerase